MTDFLTFLLTPLLTKPEALAIVAKSAVVTVHVAHEDMGRVIGKHGIIISALRTLVRTFCLTHNLPTVTLTLADDTKTDSEK